MFLAD